MKPRLTSHKSHDDLSLRCGKLTSMSDDISRSITSAVSQTVQRTVDQALSCLSITSTSATSSSSATSISTTNSTSTSISQGVCSLMSSWEVEVCEVELIVEMEVALEEELSAVSQAVQRAVNQALLHLPITSTGASNWLWYNRPTCLWVSRTCCHMYWHRSYIKLKQTY